MNFYTPSQTVERSGFSLDTLRYYEKIGLLDDVARASSGQRRFSDADLSWLDMLRCLRDTGMPIAEMLRFKSLTNSGDGTIRDRIDLLEAHHQAVEERIAHLRTQQKAIHNKIEYYRSVLSE
ncbi:MAG TPA: MerR family transcriptional regulator [Jiangellaceae bacterium]